MFGPWLLTLTFVSMWPNPVKINYICQKHVLLQIKRRQMASCKCQTCFHYKDVILRLYKQIGKSILVFVSVCFTFMGQILLQNKRNAYLLWRLNIKINLVMVGYLSQNLLYCPQLTFNLLIMIVKTLQTTRRLVKFQAVCHSANMSSKFL